jgi:hypothetical protein
MIGYAKRYKHINGINIINKNINVSLEAPYS